MRRSIQTLMMVAALAGTTAGAQDRTLALSLKGAGGLQLGGGTVDAFFPGVEYQGGINSLMSFTVGLGYLNYTYKDHSSGPVTLTDGWITQSKGKGPVVSGELRFYPGRKVFEDFYVGPGVSVMAIKQDNTNTNPSFNGSNPAPVVTTSSNSTTVAEVHGRVGWAFKSGDLYIDPHVQLGYFLSAPDTGSSQSSKIGLYALIGLNLGMKF